MKNKILCGIVFILLILPVTVVAQQPTKEELEQMRKAMEKMKADPAMIDAMKKAGIDMNQVENSMKQIENNGLENYYEIGEFMVPGKDAARIATLNRKPLLTSELPAHLLKAEKRVNAALTDGDKKIIDLLYTKAKTSADSLSGIANGMWVTGHYLPALYMMGKACQKDSNPDNLNNYAAFLVMTGAEELALPVLQKLNREFPKNGTVLNNIGQAWFGLGDLTQAGKYLDSVVMIYSYHPQANMTQCLIKYSQGDKTGAIQSLKNSSRGGYSPEKEAMLRKLGYKISGKDLGNDIHMPQDPLGFDKWITAMPAFPRTYTEQLAVIPEWEYFKQSVEDERRKLEEKLARLKNEINSRYTNSKTGKVDAAKVISMSMPPYLSAKATHILNQYLEDKDARNGYQSRRITELQTRYEQESKKADATFETVALAVQKKLDAATGEGRSNNYEPCPDLVPAHDAMISVKNSNYEEWVNELLNLLSTHHEAAAYYYQYQVSDQLLIDQLELMLKLEFINMLKSIHPHLEHEPIRGCQEEDEHAPSRKLQDWNDLHCDHKITFDVPLTGTMKFTCNTTELELNPEFLPFEAQLKQSLETGEWISASAGVSMKMIKVGSGYDFTTGKGKAEIGAGTKLGGKSLGPLEIKGSVSVGAVIEFDKDGISDFGMEAKLGGKAEVSSSDVELTVGKIEGGAKWGWNAGPSGVAKGALHSSLTPSTK